MSRRKILSKSVAHKLRCQGDIGGALAAIRKAQGFAPDDVWLQMYLAHLLAVCPDPKLRDAKRAVELASKAVAANPARRAVGRRPHERRPEAHFRKRARTAQCWSS